VIEGFAVVNTFVECATNSAKVLILIKMEFVMNKLRMGLLLLLYFGWIGQSWAGFSEGLLAYDKGDYKTALNEFKPLAHKGNAVAQVYLGWMYDDGKGVMQDYKEAVKWYRLSAEQGNAFAQYLLGYMYGKGEGVLRNDIMGYMWATIAAHSGQSSAKGLREEIAEKMDSSHILKALKLAKKCVASNYKNCG
jgi:TPR repeat protein